MKKRFIVVNFFMAAVLVLSGFGSTGRITPARAAGEKAVGINVKTPSQQEIAKRLKGLDTAVSSYETDPGLSAPYSAGTLSAKTLEEGLKWTNAMRFIAGIPDNVKFNEDYNLLAQASSIVNFLHGYSYETPARPSGMGQELYDQGCLGSLNSIRIWKTGGASLYGSGVELSEIFNFYISGTNKGSLVLRPRRILLNPSMETAGLGIVWGYGGKGSQFNCALYFGDQAAETSDYYGVAWPAQNMPISLFGNDNPWSISMGCEVPDDTTVTLTRTSDNKTWKFSEGSSDFIIENSAVGQQGCIFFRPDNIYSYRDGDEFKVDIKGSCLNVSSFLR